LKKDKKIKIYRRREDQFGRRKIHVHSREGILKIHREKTEATKEGEEEAKRRRAKEKKGITSGETTQKKRRQRKREKKEARGKKERNLH